MPPLPTPGRPVRSFFLALKSFFAYGHVKTFFLLVYI
jgi:hypothetical protein